MDAVGGRIQRGWCWYNTVVMGIGWGQFGRVGAGISGWCGSAKKKSPKVRGRVSETWKMEAEWGDIQCDYYLYHFGSIWGGRG